MTLTGPRGGEGFVPDLIDDHCLIGTHLVGEKIPIKHIIDMPLMTMSFTIEKVAGTRSTHLNMQVDMLCSLECMAPTIFN